MPHVSPWFNHTTSQLLREAFSHATLTTQRLHTQLYTTVNSKAGTHSHNWMCWSNMGKWTCQFWNGTKGTQNLLTTLTTMPPHPYVNKPTQWCLRSPPPCWGTRRPLPVLFPLQSSHVSSFQMPLLVSSFPEARDESSCLNISCDHFSSLTVKL